MKLIVDIGNTAIKFAYSDNDAVTYIGRFYTSQISKSKLDEFIGNLDNLEQIYISSVVPAINNIVDKYFKEKYSLKPIYLKVGDYPEIKVDIDEPNELGIDLYCDIVSGYEISKKENKPVIIIDLGTATKLLYIDQSGVFNKCAIIPGIELNKKILSSSTALLPFSELERVKNISEARNTIDVLNSSIYFSHIDAINGLINRLEKETNSHCLYVVTGGNAKVVLDHLKEPHILDEQLCFNGINKIIKGYKL